MNGAPFFEIFVDASTAGLRLDKVLATHPQCSRTRGRKLLAKGAVWVDGKRIKIAGRRMKSGQRIRVYHGPTVQPDVVSAGLPLRRRVIFASEDVIAVNKPAGLCAVPTPADDRWVLSNLLQNALGLEKPLIAVHRIDRDTSGVLVFARHRQAARRLTELQMEGACEKRYRAVCIGRPADKDGLWNWPLAKDPSRGDRRRIAARGGVRAETRYRVLKEDARYPGLFWLELELLTGRTHQIRVHSAHAGCPLVGDSWYGRSKSAAPIFDRHGVRWRASALCLHSRCFRIRCDGWLGGMEWRADLPDPFVRCVRVDPEGGGFSAPSDSTDFGLDRRLR
jgi:23S rRNA pseudouridine1911/1915/1917 synthase